MPGLDRSRRAQPFARGDVEICSVGFWGDRQANASKGRSCMRRSRKITLHGVVVPRSDPGPAQIGPGHVTFPSGASTQERAAGINLVDVLAHGWDMSPLQGDPSSVETTSGVWDCNTLGHMHRPRSRRASLRTGDRPHVGCLDGGPVPRLPWAELQPCQFTGVEIRLGDTGLQRTIRADRVNVEVERATPARALTASRSILCVAGCSETPSFM